MQESFEPGIKDWLEEVKLYASNDICKLLVGNKCDLSEKREVDFLDAKVRANSNQQSVLPLSELHHIWEVQKFHFITTVSALYLQDFADKVEIPFMEVSAKDATNVEQAFMTIVAQIRSKRYAHVP